MSDPVQCMYDLNSHAIEIYKILIPEEKNSRYKNIFEFKGGLQNGNCTLKMLLSYIMLYRPVVFLPVKVLSVEVSLSLSIM